MAADQNSGPRTDLEPHSAESVHRKEQGPVRYLIGCPNLWEYPDQEGNARNAAYPQRMNRDPPCRFPSQICHTVYFPGWPPAQNPNRANPHRACHGEPIAPPSYPPGCKCSGPWTDSHGFQGRRRNRGFSFENQATGSGRPHQLATLWDCSTIPCACRG